MRGSTVDASRLFASRLSLLAAFVVFPGWAVAPAAAALIARDSFHTTPDGAGDTYRMNMPGSVPNVLWGQDPSADLSGFTGAWGGTGTATNDLRVSTDSLSHPLIAGGTSPGQLITRDGGSTDRGVFRALASVPGAGSYYASFAMAIGSNPDVAVVSALGLRQAAGFDRSTPIDNSSLRGVSVGFSGSDINVWVNGAASLLLAGFTPGETYFTLIHVVDNGAGVNDSITVSVYGAAATDLLNPAASLTITTADISGSFTHLAFQKHGSGSGTIQPARFDEFRFGTELSEVAIPEPAGLALLGSAGGLLLLRRRGR